MLRYAWARSHKTHLTPRDPRLALGAPTLAIVEEQRGVLSEREQNDQEARLLRELWGSSPDGMLLVGASGRILMANAAAERIFGFGPAELVGLGVEALVPERYREQHRPLRAGYSAAPHPRTSSVGLDIVGLRKDGSEFPGEVLLSPLPGSDNGGALTLATVRDITGYKAAEGRLSHFAALVESSDDAIIEETTDGIAVVWNPAAERLYGWSAEEMVGKPASVLVPPGVDDLARRARSGEHVAGVETVRVRKDGSRVDVLLTVSPVRDEHGNLVGTSTVARDVSALVAHREQLRYLADHDGLTGVVNRRRFEIDLNEQLGRARRYGEPSAVMVIDLDNFKQVNDRYGHLAGDEALKAVACALGRRLRSTDTLARLGGDELGVLLPHTGPDEAAAVEADLGRAVSGIELDVTELDGGAPCKLHLSVSVGIAPLGPGAASVEDVLLAADQAMYLQKATHEATRPRHR